MTIIDADKFVSYLIYSKHIDGLTCGEVKEAVEMCKVDVLDRLSALDKIRAEIIDTLYVDSLIFGELIAYRDGKISTDDVIEEFNRATRAEALKIIDKYRESEE